MRRRILAFLTAFSLVSYLARTNISVAAKFMMPELRLTETQMGQVFSSFMLGYALFQVPAGIAGDRRGPRLVLTLSAVLWALASILTGLIPGAPAVSVRASFALLLTVRFLLGAAEAATYPVALRAVANWMPPHEHAFSNAVIIGGLAAGSTFSPLLFSWLMVSSGWRSIFFATAGVCVALAAGWRWYATDTPRQHRSVGNRELALILHAGVERAASARSQHLNVEKRNLALLCASYFLDSYVLFIFIFWLYLYLVDVRGFSVLRGGVFTGMPYLLAIFLVPAAGRTSDWLSGKLGTLRGRRIVAMSGLIASALFMVAGARATNAYLAIANLSLSAAVLMCTEGPFWSMSIEVGKTGAGAAGGIMNTAGNLGGVVSTALVPALVEHFGWVRTLASAAVLSVAAALFWLLIREKSN